MQPTPFSYHQDSEQKRKKNIADDTLAQQPQKAGNQELNGALLLHPRLCRHPEPWVPCLILWTSQGYSGSQKRKMAGNMLCKLPTGTSLGLLGQ